MSDLLRRLFPGHRDRGPEAAPADFSSPEAGLRFSFAEGSLSVFMIGASEPLFAVEGAAAVRLRTVRTERGGHPAILLNLGEQLQITCVQFGHARPGKVRNLVRATRKRQPEGGQALELTFASGPDQIRYLVELGPSLQATGFREVSPVEAIFTEIPPLSQMVAFLKATLHQRRTALRSLRGLARRCADPQVREGIEDMEARLSPGHDFTQPVVVELREALEAQGRPVYVNTLVALCLMADLYLGRINRSTIDAVVGRDEPLILSDDAAAAAARFLGGRPARPATAAADRALGFLWAAVAERSARTILEDLAEDSGSVTSRARVRRLLEKVALDQGFANDEQTALRSYLAACGRTIHPDTVAALCLYVDFEAGILAEEDIDALTPARSFVDHSLYAILSVAGAFEVDLRCLVLPEAEEPQMWWGLKCLVLMGHHGLLARFLEPGSPGYLTRHLADPASVDQARADGLSFTGEVLVQFPVLDYLEVRDLNTFLQKDVLLLACFQSEDRAQRWRVVEPGTAGDPKIEAVTGPHGFIETFRAFRFQGKVVGRLAEAEARSLVGQAQVVAVYLDHRGNRHYQCLGEVLSVEQVQKPPAPGLEWSGQVAVFPGLDRFPRDLVEPGPDYLLGRPEDASAESLRLTLCYRAVQASLVQHPTLVLLDSHPQETDRLRRLLRSDQLRSAVLGVVGTITRHALVTMLGEQGDPVPGQIRLAPAVLTALGSPEGEQVAALLVLYALCSSPRIPLRPRDRDWRPEAYLDLLQDRLFALAESESASLRAAACTLLGTEVAAGSRARREAAAYLLARHMEGAATGEAAVYSLAALALAPTVPAPPAVEVWSWTAEPPDRDFEQLEVDEQTSDLRAWLGAPGSPAEIPARANLRGEDLKIGVLARLLVRANRAARQDGSVGAERRLVILPAEEESFLRQALLKAWQTFATSRGLALENLKSRQAYREFLGFLEERELSLARAPRLRGYSVYTLPPGAILAVGSSPLFLRLASLVPATGGQAGPTILRLPVDVPADGPLDPGLCQVFGVEGGSWQDFLRGSGTLAAGWSDRSAWEALCALYASLASPAPVQVQQPSAEPARIGVEAPALALEDLAEEVARVFNLPRERRNSALNILMGLAPRSRWPLPPVGIS